MSQAHFEIRPNEAAWPTPPAIAVEPLSIGGVRIPSRFFLAPLAGYTGLPYRRSVRELGGLGLATTDLVNARALIERRPRSLELSATTPDDKPVSIQIYGNVADEMRQAARIAVERGATIIDINMGCPVRKVVKTGGGSALMCNVVSATSLVAAVVDSVSVPVTVKMRLGWDADNLTAPELARSFESVGAAAVILHGRTREQGFGGRVNLEGIRATVEAVDRLPIVGNGDIRSIDDVRRMFVETGCAAVSIGRGALADPFFFRRLAHWASHGDPGPEPGFEERVGLMRTHFSRLVDHLGERIACLQFRKLVKWYGYSIHPPKDLYLRLIQLPNAALFHETVSRLLERGPARRSSADRSAPAIPLPSGPIDKW